jgi:Niemann-Pick C2 protein
MFKLNSLICLVLLSVVAISFAEENEGLKVFKCNGIKRTTATINKLEITDCPSFPCKLKKGETPFVTMNLTTKRRIGDMKLKIAGDLLGKIVPFPVDDTNHCVKTTGKECPIERDTTFDYKFGLEVLQTHPSLSLSVQYQIVDDTDKTVACFTFPAMIVE